MHVIYYASSIKLLVSGIQELSESMVNECDTGFELYHRSQLHSKNFGLKQILLMLKYFLLSFGKINLHVVLRTYVHVPQ